MEDTCKVGKSTYQPTGKPDARFEVGKEYTIYNSEGFYIRDENGKQIILKNMLDWSELKS